MASCIPKTDFCSKCTKETKYVCMNCRIPICNVCSYAEENEETPGWSSGRSVGYCGECSKEEGAENEIPDKRATKTSPRINTATLQYESDDESLASGDEDEMLNIFKGKKSKRKKKPGRKAQWPESLLNNLIDIIANDDYFKKKLIFTNTRNRKNGEIYQKVLTELKSQSSIRNEECPYTAIQLRTKFKKSVAECKKAALLIKTGSGIKRFQDHHGYGTWFNQLFALVKTRESCQPEQAIEPSAIAQSDAQSPIPCGASPATSSDSQELFVPVPAKRRKTRKEGQFHDLMEMMNKLVEKDPMSDFLAFAREEAEKSRQHELKLVQLLMKAQNPPQQANYANIQGQQLMHNFSSYYQF
ncbi:uncharacterized protein LOC135683145 [Rhopilema esculentum]|uniref:uncharacterized protein LOC135683145 n=1 Tax=Rhopilema esculentum TaxID=499914 RepID=UPI0031DB59A0|eukprot:gene16105-7459_t